MPAATPKVASRRVRQVLAACSVLAAIGASVLVAATSSSHSSSAATSANAVRKVPNKDIALVMRTAGFTPEHLAAAGVTRLEFDGLADAALAYCLQADRVLGFQTAHKNLNIMRANATKVPGKRTVLEGQGVPTTLAQAQGQLDDLKNAAFNFIATELPGDKKAKLASIRANDKHAVPAYYKVVERTDAQWLELRNALSAKRIADKQSKPCPEQATSVLSAAHGNQTVSACKDGYAAALAIIKDEWAIKLPRQAQDSGDHP